MIRIHIKQPGFGMESIRPFFFSARLFVLLLTLSLAISLAIKAVVGIDIEMPSTCHQYVSLEAWLPPSVLQKPSVSGIAKLLCKVRQTWSWKMLKVES